MEHIVAKYISGHRTYYYIPEEGKIPRPAFAFPMTGNEQAITDFKWYRHGGLPCYVDDNGGYDFYLLEDQHRLNGPSLVEFHNEEIDITRWNIYDIEIDPEEYFIWLEQHGIDINNITTSDKVLIAIEWNDK